MISAAIDTLAAAAIAAKLRSLSGKVRRQVLQTIGNEAAKPLIEALKSESIPEVSGTLEKSLGKKVKVYSVKCVVFVAVGPKSKTVVVDPHEYYVLAESRKGITRNRIGPRGFGQTKTLNPAHYAHLAGPGRRGTFVPNVRRRMAGKVRQVIAETLRREVNAR